MTKKVFITGASGFIGGKLWEYLGRQHYEVTACITSEPAGKSQFGRTYTLRLPDERLATILREIKPDYVVHCAGGSLVWKSLLFPDLDFQNNVIATESLFRAIAMSCATTKVIFISSAAVYGNATELPIREDTPIAPISPYGFHKSMAELICQKYSRIFQIPLTILRPFSAYGPGLKKQILWDIYQQWLKSDVISLQGTGEESRDFIYVDELAKSIQVVMEKSHFRAEIYNVASGQETTIRHLIDIMLDALGKPKTVLFTGQVRSGDPLRWRADVSKIKTFGLHGWLTIEEGVKNYVRWLKEDVER